MPTPSAYTATAKLLHWLIALLVIGLVGIGLYMTRATLALPEKFQLYQLHKSIGFTVLGLMFLRVLWRLTHRPPPLPPTMPILERVAAHAAHALLYVLLLALPLSGWLMVSSSSLPVPTRWFGQFQIPHFAPVSGLAAEDRKPYEALFKEIHFVLAASLVVLVVVHVAAALRHHLVLKDDTLRRMLPGRARASLLAAAVALAAPVLVLPDAPALAQDAPRWTVDKAKSSIAFEARAGGQRMAGRLTAYAVELQLDPAAPEKTRIKVTFDVAGITTGTAEIDDAFAGKDWFNAKAHPQAVFAADKAEKASDGSYRLIGTLSLKGKSAPVTLPFTLAIDANRARAKGEVIVDRLVFGVGPVGPVMDTVIGKDVKVLIAIEADKTG